LEGKNELAKEALGLSENNPMGALFR